jgi:hypothetical protein
MPGQPEGPDVLRAVAVKDVLDDIVQVLVVGLADPAARRLLGGGRRCRDHKTIQVLEIGRREIQSLPGADRTAAVQVEDEGHRLAWSQVVWVIEVKLSPGLLVHGADMAHARSPRSLCFRDCRRP